MSSALRRLKLLLWCIIVLTVSSCDDTEDNEVEGFFERQNAAHEGDYIATYPLSDPDSCIARLKEEVPKALQPWACLSLWYHLPRDSPEVNFRLLELYEENYPHDTVFAFCQMMRAEFYVDLAEFDLAEKYMEDAYRRYMELGRTLDAEDARYLQARSYIYQNKFVEAQYENTQKEHRIESLEQEQLALRLRQFIWALALLAVILLLTTLYIRQHNHRLILVQQNRLLSQEKELINAREKLKSKALMHSRNQLEDAKKELNETGQALALKSRLIRELQIKLSQKAGPSSPSEAGHASQESSELKSMKILTDQDWLVFKERYEECFPGFLDKLKEMFPKLTSGETRLILLMKLKFDNREAAESLGISLQSVWRSRHRLSRKLGLNTTGDLDVFIERL